MRYLWAGVDSALCLLHLKIHVSGGNAVCSIVMFKIMAESDIF